MCSHQYLAQEFDDMEVYFPGGIDVDEAEEFKSPDALTHSFIFDSLPSAHRTCSDIFEPILVDIEVLEELKNDASIVPDKHPKNYLLKTSNVVPYVQRASKESISRARSPLSPSRREPMNILQIFMVYDAITGRERRPLLHEFIRMLVEDDEFSYIAEYVDRRQDIFKLHKPKEISELWKQVKGRNSDNRK